LVEAKAAKRTLRSPFFGWVIKFWSRVYARLKGRRFGGRVTYEEAVILIQRGKERR